MAVVVVGSVNIDLVVRVGRLPSPGETVLGTTLERSLGGKGANAAVAAARQGADIRLIGCVGDDEAGSWAVQSLADEGIDVSAVRVESNVSTGHALISVRPDGIGQITVAPLANSLLTPADVATALADLKETDVVVAQLEVPMETVAAAFSSARAVGATTVLDPAPAMPLSDALLALVDVLMPNEHELSALGGDPKALLRSGVGTVVVTRGEEGCDWLHGDRIERVRSHNVEVIDTTGAGDAFCGAFAASLTVGADRRAALTRAVAAGALATTRPGAFAAMPTAREVDDVLSGAG